jgi:hypothetical protein
MPERCGLSTSIGLTLAAEYEIRVKGELDARWQAWFEGMTITASDDETIIRGTVEDHHLLSEQKESHSAQPH